MNLGHAHQCPLFDSNNSQDGEHLCVLAFLRRHQILDGSWGMDNEWVHRAFCMAICGFWLGPEDHGRRASSHRPRPFGW